ncbi:ribonucleoside triphosphate reductase [Candidatus Aerophobetes bacterium]|uniref:Ribonucleoside triphosphate reductase n=1 Tax=Aerophobetes bacterium TaxID=2030807 RepID=A0A523RT56_UNCAE|nr:MAG: ribonucleoside triphosphate reductase [Candidatus Aerophobetes bacterium]
MTKLSKIRKRDSRVVDFDEEKITKAIWAAAQAVGGRDRKLAERLSTRVVVLLGEKFPQEIPGVEDVQDVVEKVLIEEGHARTAKAYILYRKQHETLRKIQTTFLEVEKIVSDYLSQIDWRVRENSNIGYSMSGLMLHVAGSVITDYSLDRIYPMEIADAHRNGDIHLHDLYFGITGYCAGWSISKLLFEGFNGVPGVVESKPAKHLDTALLQMANFIGTLQNEWAGAQAFNSIDTYLAPLVRKDALNYNQVKQAVQKFVFNLNITSRWGGQSPFTNLTFDWTVPDDLKKQPVVLGGELLKETYGDYQKEMDLINKAFIEVLIEGDMRGRPFTFPIPTYNLTRDFDWENENAKLLFEMTAKYGLSYFSNFINSNLNPSDVRSMCCRLRLDLRQLDRNVTGGLFGSGDSTGSIGVVTINMPRIAYLSKDKNEFFDRLEYLMGLAKTSLEIKRGIVNKNMEGGLLPYSKRYLGTLKNHFSTIGPIGMNEACLNLLGKDIASKEGKNFAVEVLEFMRARLSDFQEETSHIYNLEAVPAEGTSFRLAKMDKAKYPDIITAGKRAPYYTNSTLLPVDKTEDAIEALEHQEGLQTLYTGGTVFHLFLGERMSSGEAVKRLLKKIAYNTRLPYITITPTYSICPDHGYFPGEHPRCPKCGENAEIYSRVVGYFRPVRNWNEGKQEEFRQRLVYKEKLALEKEFAGGI